MRFNYRIVGRGDGSLDQTEYAGTVSAQNPKMGLIAALAAEFGDEDQATPVAALTASGWTDEATLLSQFDGLDSDDGNAEFSNDDTTFLIEVEEVDDEAENPTEKTFTVSLVLTAGGDESDPSLGLDANVDFVIPAGIKHSELERLIKVLAGSVRDAVLADVWPTRVAEAQICT